MTQPPAKRRNGPHPRMWPVAEFAVVFGLCMAILFVVIPAGTAESDNFGLSPRMLPIVTISAIAVFSVVTLIVGLVRGGPRKAVETDGLGGVALLVGATFAGVLAIDRAGIVVGGTMLVVLASLAIGERRPLVVGGMGIAAVLVLLLVDWSGL